MFYNSQLKAVVGEPPVPESVALEDQTAVEFEVARILDRCVVRGQEQFLIRWKGYGAHEDTWEPTCNLDNSRRLLEEFRASP